ncbi:hypothetical protein HYC85_000513 [Camellia sinensis]|uniref:RING-type domain-containing protein n=1 Tax=Camellia sinensis TaxID=4442 RepID=A0A7J7I4J0_CAMSI|nr:hypothetical protein HYC85_000513 [Camellia sinensis]
MYRKVERFEVMDEECSKKQLKICLDVEHAKCSICLNIWHDVVTVAPCLHNFCNGCFSEWLRRSQEKHSSVLCPQCRAVVQFVGRNHFLHNIEEDILQTDSSLKRSDEEIALLDSYASVKSPLVISTGRNTHRKRARLPPDEESDVVDLPCPQCGTELAGFQCNQNTIHLQCQACGGMMPSRNNLRCDRAFCGAYWRAQSVFESDSHPVCSREALKPISEHTITRIPQLAHENNQHEQDITERCISQTGRTLQDVISDWITKLENREIDRTRMPLNHAEMITAATHICSDCYDKLVSFLLYWFRISVPKYMQLKGKIAGMDIHVGRNTTVKNMLVKEIMFAVQPGVEICRVCCYLIYALYESDIQLCKYTFIAGKDGCEVSC